MGDEMTVPTAQALSARVELARSRAERYWESNTVKLSINSTGTSILLAIYRTRYSCPFFWKNRLNRAQSTRNSPSNSSQFTAPSSDGMFSRMNSHTQTRYSTTVSANLSLRWVSRTSVNLRMAVASSVPFLLQVRSQVSKGWSSSRFAYSSASESSPLCCSSSLSSPTSTQVSAA